MDAQLTHHEARSLFGALVDDALAGGEALRLRSHLDGCDTCHQGWVRYEETVLRVRNVPRERAPTSLAGVILRRERRRRPLSKRLYLAQLEQRVPVEIIVPILLAAALVVLVALLGH